MKILISNLVVFLVMAFLLISFQNCSGHVTASGLNEATNFGSQGPGNVTVENGVAYITDANGNHIAPIPVNVNSRAYIEGDFLYARGSNSIVVYDISDPYRPQLLAQHSIMVDSYMSSLAEHAGYVYIPNFYNGLEVYDVHDLSNIRLISTLAFSKTGAADIFIKNQYAYVSVCDSLYVIDLSNPASPQLAKDIVLGTRPSVCAMMMGLQNNVLSVLPNASFDISNPAEPLKISAP